ncbi:LysR family transcriptional regulator [Pseudorhodoferax sp. LjRoot39]
MTFKQLEAVLAIAEMGSFERAAARLHTTQSAISKRIQELEAVVGTPVFDRSQRRARLTEHGESMVEQAQQMLAQRTAFVEEFSRPDTVARRVRIGVTELTALTWLPQLVRLIQQQFPKVVIEPDVDLSVLLRDKLARHEVDLIFVPDAFADAGFTYKPLSKVENAWMCQPGLVPNQRTVSLHDLAAHTLLTQGNLSGSGLVFDQWLKSKGVVIERTICSNSLVALIGLTLSGLGVSYLPLQCMGNFVDSGALSIVRTDPALPLVQYVCMYRSETRSPLIGSIVMLAQHACDFSRAFQWGDGSGDLAGAFRTAPA